MVCELIIWKLIPNAYKEMDILKKSVRIPFALHSQYDADFLFERIRASQRVRVRDLIYFYYKNENCIIFIYSCNDLILTILFRGNESYMKHEFIFSYACRQ